MAEKWKGFTEEDIQNLSNTKSVYPDQKLTSVSVNKRISKENRRYIRKNVIREQMLHGLKNTDLPKEARLSIPQIPEEEEIEENDKIKIVESKKTVVSVNENNSGNKSIESSETNNDIRRNFNQNKLINEPVLCSNADQDTLLEFQERQKCMEEQNRQRKEILKKALEDRTKQTHAEARRLNQIEEELKKLDMQLSCDVAILRNQIELASLDFMEAQKRYDRAEREYLDAKLSLFNKKEHKELLTSHLCTIIEQNELRKAKKLSDLMEKLELGNVIETKNEASKKSDTYM